MEKGGGRVIAAAHTIYSGNGSGETAQYTHTKKRGG